MQKQTKGMSKYAVGDSKESRFNAEQEATGLLNSLGIYALLSQIPLVVLILFWRYKMNKIINKFLISGDTFMRGMHLRPPAALDEPGFTYSACGLWKQRKNTKTGNRIFKIYLLKQTR